MTLIYRKLRKLKLADVQLVSGSDFYSQAYGEMNATAIDGSLSSRVLHQSLELGLKKSDFPYILEIGGNTGEHIKHVTSTYEKYICSDLKMPNAETRKKFGPRIEFEAQNAENLNLRDDSFDRVIFTCVLHHLSNPSMALQNARKVTKNGGLISIALPNDPGLMYRFLRSLTTLRNAKRLNKLNEIQLIHAKEHRNHFLSLEWLIREVFKDDVILKRSIPFAIHSYNLNPLTIYQIRISK
jgi:phosphatidylethanolamine/phosphatidyl-N-methylethanolamine N-methyltransferase